MSQPIARLDAAAAALEQNTVGRAPSDVLLLAARILFGFPLLMNGVGQIDNPASPSRIELFICGRSPLLQSAAVCSTRYRMGPPSGRSLRVMGRGTQTNSVRISSADNRTFA